MTKPTPQGTEQQSFHFTASQWALERIHNHPGGIALSTTIALASSFLAEHYSADAMLFALLIGMAFNFTKAEDRVGIGQVPEWAPENFTIPVGATAGLIQRFSWAEPREAVEYSRTWFDASRADYVQRGLLSAAEIRRKRGEKLLAHSNCRRYLDEGFVKFNGEIQPHWRAVDHEGNAVETFVSKRSDRRAALKFLRNSNQ